MDKLIIRERQPHANYDGSAEYIERNPGQLATISLVEINGRLFEMVAMHPMDCVRLESDDNEFTYGVFFDAFEGRRIRLEPWTKTGQCFDIDNPNCTPW